MPRRERRSFTPEFKARDGGQTRPNDNFAGSAAFTG